MYIKKYKKEKQKKKKKGNCGRSMLFKCFRIKMRGGCSMAHTSFGRGRVT